MPAWRLLHIALSSNLKTAVELTREKQGNERHFQIHLVVCGTGVTGFLFGFSAPEDGTDMLSRNVDRELPLHAA